MPLILVDFLKTQYKLIWFGKQKKQILVDFKKKKKKQTLFRKKLFWKSLTKKSELEKVNAIDIDGLFLKT